MEKWDYNLAWNHLYAIKGFPTNVSYRIISYLYHSYTIIYLHYSVLFLLSKYYQTNKSFIIIYIIYVISLASQNPHQTCHIPVAPPKSWVPTLKTKGCLTGRLRSISHLWRGWFLTHDIHEIFRISCSLIRIGGQLVPHSCYQESWWQNNGVERWFSTFRRTEAM